MKTNGKTGSGAKRKRLIIVAVLLSLCVSPGRSHAFEVIVLTEREIKPYRDAIEGFRSVCNCRLRELDLSDSLAIDKAVKARPDAIFALGVPAFRKARAIKNIPVVYALVMPSEEADASAAHLSGVSMDVDPGTYLSSMTELFPDVKKIGILSNLEQTGPYVEAAEAAGRAKGIVLIVKSVDRPSQISKRLEELRGKIDALWLLPDPTIASPEAVDYLLLYSIQNSIPVFTFSRKYVERGAASALIIDPYDMGIQSAEVARRLAQGEQGPLRLYARNPSLIVNKKVIEKMGTRYNVELLKNAHPIMPYKLQFYQQSPISRANRQL